MSQLTANEVGRKRGWHLHRALVAAPYAAALCILDCLVVLAYNQFGAPLLVREPILFGLGLLMTSLVSLAVIAFSRNRDLPVTFACRISLYVLLIYLTAIILNREFYSITLTGFAYLTTCVVGSMLAIHVAKFLADKTGWIGGPNDEDRRSALGPEIVDLDHAELDRVDCDILVVANPTDRINANIVANAYAKDIEVIGFPRFYEYRFARVYLPDFNVIDLSYTINQKFYIRVKRFIDVATCILLAPLILLLAGFTAIYILIISGRPILFRQTRVGLNDVPFQILKFRTMSAVTPELAETTTQIGDMRIIAGGHFLRRCRLDELPQFLHILSGKMSLIGPRPEWSVLVDRYAPDIPQYNYRHLVRPGLSGWAQVKMGYASDIEETKRKVSYDLYYVKYISLELDLRVLIKTLRIIFAGAGAR